MLDIGVPFIFVPTESAKEAAMKTLRCRDAGFDCNKEIRAESEDEIMQQAAEHARRDHNVEVTPEMAAQVRSLIRNEKQQA